MRKILVALPCLLIAGFGLVNDAHAFAKKKAAAKAEPKAAEAAPATPAADSKRFNMTQNGKKMTADDFDAWMKKNGYRVATGAPAKQAEEPQKGTK